MGGVMNPRKFGMGVPNVIGFLDWGTNFFGDTGLLMMATKPYYFLW